MNAITNQAVLQSSEPEMGRFKKSWLLLKGSWRALRLDKELAALPVMGGLLTILILALTAILVLPNHEYFARSVQQAGSSELRLTPAGYAVMITLGIIITGVNMIFSGAIIHGALQRFRGNDPTIRSSMQAAMKRAGSLVGFGAFSYLIGYLLSAIAERIPGVGGRIVLWLANSAWNVASFFAIPVIVTSETPINPIQATKQSIGLIKKVWGESLIISASIALVSTLIMVVYTLLFGITAGFAIPNISGEIFAGLVMVWVFGFVAMIIILTALESFAKAAIYHYATTGESPAVFDARLMRQFFVPKKARKALSS